MLKSAIGLIGLGIGSYGLLSKIDKNGSIRLKHNLYLDDQLINNWDNWDREKIPDTVKYSSEVVDYLRYYNKDFLDTDVIHVDRKDYSGLSLENIIKHKMLSPEELMKPNYHHEILDVYYEKLYENYGVKTIKELRIKNKYYSSDDIREQWHCELIDYHTLIKEIYGFDSLDNYSYKTDMEYIVKMYGDRPLEKLIKDKKLGMDTLFKCRNTILKNYQNLIRKTYPDYDKNMELNLDYYKQSENYMLKLYRNKPAKSMCSNLFEYKNVHKLNIQKDDLPY
jgi:hypothetical protein